MLGTLRRAEYAELITLFFIQGAAMSMWFVPLGSVLDAHGLHELTPLAFASTALAAFVSPLIFGAMADHHASPNKVLRGLALATAAAMMLASLAIHLNWNRWMVLSLIQLHALCTAPTFSISSTIVFARLADAKKEFGSIRAVATFGWALGCLLVSLLNADGSALSGFSGAIAWLVVAGFTFFLPELKTPRAMERLSLKQRLGLDALALLKNPDHRVVFFTVALFAIPLTGFYPYAPTHLRELGFQHTTAWMSLAQSTEVLCMLMLGLLLTKWRLKWIFAAGLLLGVLRFSLSAVNGPIWLLGGVFLHGASFTLVYITSQIYLDHRVDVRWRARAQALMTLMTNGLGNLVGYLSTGWWFNTCTKNDVTRWPIFWSGLAAMVAGVLVYFLTTYRGRERELADL